MTTVNAACQGNLSSCHFGHACHKFVSPTLRSSETSVNIYHSALPNIRKKADRYEHCSGNLKDSFSQLFRISPMSPVTSPCTVRVLSFIASSVWRQSTAVLQRVLCHLVLPLSSCSVFSLRSGAHPKEGLPACSIANQKIL